MRRLSFVAVVTALAVSGCVAHMTPYGVSIEPLADIYVAGPPVVVEPPPSVVFRPLPPVVVVPDRRVYRYDNRYYYYWGDSWYWGREQRGPWYPLERRYWPPRVERRDRGGGGFERR
jgi:hypothetical protein